MNNTELLTLWKAYSDKIKESNSHDWDAHHKHMQKLRAEGKGETLGWAPVTITPRWEDFLDEISEELEKV